MLSDSNRRLRRPSTRRGHVTRSLCHEGRFVSVALESLSIRLSAIDEGTRTLDDHVSGMTTEVRDLISRISRLSNEVSQNSSAQRFQTAVGWFSGLMTFFVGGLTIGNYTGSMIAADALVALMIGGSLTMMGLLILWSLSRRRSERGTGSS